MSTVMYKKAADGAYKFTNAMRTSDAERVAKAYRKLGYDAIDVACPS